MDLGDMIGIIGVSLVAVVLIFCCAILGALLGAAAGYIVGFTPIGGWILNFLYAAKISTNMVDLGAFVGFAGGFFRGSNSS